MKKNWKIIVRYNDGTSSWYRFSGTEVDAQYETLRAGYTFEADQEGIAGADYEAM